MTHMSIWDDPALDRQLTAAWNQLPQLSTREIGDRMHMTKNAILGRAHRIGLPARPSPVRAKLDADGQRIPYTDPRALRRHGIAPLPVLPSEASHVAVKPILLASMRPDAVSRVAKPQPVLEAPIQPYGRTMNCQWPIGTPGTAKFKFCSDRSAPGVSYCARHMTQAYLPAREDRRHG